MTCRAAVARSLMIAVLTLGIDASAQSPVRVFVAVPPNPSGFVDRAMKDRDATVKDLIGELKRKKKTLTVVDAESAADIIVELSSVAIVDGDLQTRANPVGGGATTSATKQYRGVAKLKVGEYATELTAQANFTFLVASHIAGDVDKWVKDNHDRLPQKN